MHVYPLHDPEFEDKVITQVRDRNITTEDGWSFGGIPADAPFNAKVGSIARFYGRGIGYVVRGLFIDGVQMFYRTETEQEERHKQECVEHDAREAQHFEEHHEEIDARVAALPQFFQDRLERFRAGNPDFRVKYEGYELFCIEQALVLATALKTVNAITAWNDLPYAKQRTVVPGWSDDHSGNTAGCAMRLACVWLQQPEAVVWQHGALVPLVGCEAYGCTHPEPAST